MLKTLMILVVLTNLRALGSSRLPACIAAVGAQGVLLALIPLLEGHVALALLTAAVKGLAFPWLLSRALREARIRREIEPVVGYNLSFLFGLASLLAGGALAARLPMQTPPESPWLLPVAFSTMLVGLFILVTRKKALTQALGYLVFENGVYLFGLAVVPETPLVMELGILLDLLVGVFVMGIAIFHISKTFDSIDTDRLSALHD